MTKRLEKKISIGIAIGLTCSIEKNVQRYRDKGESDYNNKDWLIVNKINLIIIIIIRSRKNTTRM